MPQQLQEREKERRMRAVLLQQLKEKDHMLQELKVNLTAVGDCCLVHGRLFCYRVLVYLNFRYLTPQQQLTD